MTNFIRGIRNLNHKRIDLGKSLVLRLFTLLFDRPSTVSTDRKHLDKILLLRLDGKIGDSITSTGFIKALLESPQKPEVTVICSPQIAWIYETIPSLKVYILKKGPLNTLFFTLTHCHEHYSCALNTSHIMTSRVLFLLRFLNIEQRIGFESSTYKCFDQNARFDINKDHVTMRYKAALELMKTTGNCRQYFLPIPSLAVERAKKWIHTNKPAKNKLVILNSFAGARLRSLNQPTSEKIVQALCINPNTTVVSIGNHNDLELAHKFVSANPQLQKIWIVSPETNFFFNCALVQLADLVISPDTAIVHLASAYNKPLVAIYREDGPIEKNSLIWAPIHKNYKIIYAPNIRAPEADINDVDVSKVVDAASQLLNDSPSS